MKFSSTCLLVLSRHITKEKNKEQGFLFLKTDLITISEIGTSKEKKT